MNHYTGSIPANPRKTDWRDDAACRTTDPEAFFASPLTSDGKEDVRQAKAVCLHCPSRQACARWALDTRQPFGVWGGMTEGERKAILRRRGRTVPNDTPHRERTLRSLWNERARLLPDGHVGWSGSVPVSFQGHYYTPAQISFRLDRGRPPVGLIRGTCGVNGCVLPAHLADQKERDQRDLCGTRPGYRRHIKRGQEPCGRCRQANTDADNRLRRTGSTKAAA